MKLFSFRGGVHPQGYKTMSANAAIEILSRGFYAFSKSA